MPTIGCQLDQTLTPFSPLVGFYETNIVYPIFLFIVEVFLGNKYEQGQVFDNGKQNQCRILLFCHVSVRFLHMPVTIFQNWLQRQGSNLQHHG